MTTPNMRSVVLEDFPNEGVAPESSDQQRTPFPRVTVVIPTLNEALNLPHVLPLVPDWVPEVIVVDGDSTDGTPEVARGLRPDVVVVNQRRRGKGAALRRGIERATGDIVVMLDADGSTDPREIPAFVEALLAGADFAKGSRFMPGGGTEDMPPYRRLGNAAFLGVVQALFGRRFTDLCYGFNAAWTAPLRQLRLDANGFEIETQMSLRAIQAGLEVVEVPSFEAPRIHGASNLWTVKDGLRIARQICSERFRSPFGRRNAVRSSGGRDPVGVMAPPSDRRSGRTAASADRN